MQTKAQETMNLGTSFTSRHITCTGSGAHPGGGGRRAAAASQTPKTEIKKQILQILYQKFYAIYPSTEIS
jgi:hypothetical protein